MTPMVRAARFLFSVVAAPEIETLEGAQSRDLPLPSEAATRFEKHQEAAITPTKSDLKFFVFSVRLTAPAHVRRRASAQAVANRTPDQMPAPA